jgi:hypothetical protein
MVNRVRTLSEYTFLSQREGIRLFLGDCLPVATNDLQLAAFTLNGKIRDAHRFSRRDAALIEPNNGGLPMLFIATHNDYYRTICKDVFEKQLGIGDALLGGWGGDPRSGAVSGAERSDGKVTLAIAPSARTVTPYSPQSPSGLHGLTGS